MDVQGGLNQGPEKQPKPNARCRHRLTPRQVPSTAEQHLKPEPKLDCGSLKDKPRYAATLSWYAAAAQAQNAAWLGCKSN